VSHGTTIISFMFSLFNVAINFGPLCTSRAKVRLHCLTAVQAYLKCKGKVIPEQAYYRGADKSLALQGRKQANISVRIA